ncbi:dimethylaniline monooxygenase 2 [Boeremia exigua]|uniref:dimethylaniline monooxygenase 2 n=1 Tax=Boeremia exigua TaxID=749465 RepID=UPI001E8E3354|nr:dimethylaniline monooxygenase 2 [Boeremia exigua]KAH6643204.1 dimethylaniline monooxygenase 2 [Boeremia exigua]
MAAQQPTAAVIGAGPAGLVALKNLLEEGFNATGFDRNPYVGGLWQYTEDDRTSVLQSTVVNISKERGCFTDFPYPEDVDSYPTAAEVQEYLVHYAEHFKLVPHLCLNATVRGIIHDDERQQWAVEIEGKDTQYFDKLVLAIGGLTSLPNLPNVEGLELFKGVSVHSRAFKKPKQFEGKRVMVVGFGNTAADTATALASVAQKVYIAHRNGARVLPRHISGRPVDHALSLRLFTIQQWIISSFPVFGTKMFDKFVKKLQDKSFKLRPEWGFEPPQVTPIVSDYLVDYLERGLIESVKGVKRILGASQVELDDGKTLDVDVIIWCTGYKTDFSMLEPRFDPTSHSSSEWKAASGSNGKQLLNLYHNVFSVEKPQSLAFLGNVHTTLAGFQLFDMASMAIAQVFKGASTLPPRPVLKSAVESHHTWLAEQASRRSNVSPGMVDGGVWMQAFDDLAGGRVNEYLGYGWKGWWFWLWNMKLCNMLMGGVWSPHVHRFFDGKRRRWAGAGAAIEDMNRRRGAGTKKCV